MEPNKTQSQSNFIIVSIALIFTFGPVGADLYLPSLLSIAKYMSSNTNMVQLSITFYMASMTISGIAYGILSDGYGRRPILMFGLTVAIIGSIICLLAKSIHVFLLGRFIQGLGAGVGTTLCRAMMRDLYSGHKLIVMSSYLSVTSISFMVFAPVIGGFIEQYINWHACFVLLLTIGFGNLLSVIFIITETHTSRNKSHIKAINILKNFNSLLKSQSFMTYSLTASLTYGGVFTWVTAGPIVLQTIYHLTALQLGFCYLLGGCMYIVGNIVNRHFIAAYGIDYMIINGLILQLLVGIALSLIYLISPINIAWLLIPISIYMFSASIIFTNATAGSLNDLKAIAGTASSLFSTIQTMGAIISSAIIALSHEKTILPVAIIFICASVFALILNYRNKIY